MSLDPTPPGRPGFWNAWTAPQHAAFALLLLGAYMFWQVAVHSLTGDLFVPVIAAALLAVVLPCSAAARRHGQTLTAAFDLRLHRPAAAVGLAAGLLALAPAGWLAGLSSQLRPPTAEYLVFLGEHLPRDTASVVVALAAVSVAAPVAEEIIFRGLIFRLARDRWGCGRAVALSALFFGVVHWQPWSLFGLVGLGVLLALLYHWTGSLLVPTVAHGAHNAVSLALLLRSRDDLTAGASEGAAFGDPWDWLVGAVSVMLLFWLLRWLRRKTQPPPG